MWTLFWDMHSGGGLKEKWSKIYIEAPKKKAIIIFYNRFGHNPERVTCTCCGADYAMDESRTLKAATAFHRNCKSSKDGNRYIEKQGDRGGRYMPLEEYVKEKDVLIIYKKDIKEEEKKGDVPNQGYVWVD